MPRRTLAPALAALLLLMSGAAHAVQVGEVVIRGLDDEMEENVRVSLSLGDVGDDDISFRRLRYMIGVAEAEAREALEPFGYYSPSIQVQQSRANGRVDVEITIDPGEPVRVRNSDVAIIGAGNRDRYLA